MMAKNKRMLAVLLAVTLVAVMLLSTAFLVEEAHHDCVGDGCQICLQMNVCRGLLKELSLVLLAALAALVALCAFRSVPRACENTSTPGTLVALKVKLSN